MHGREPREHQPGGEAVDEPPCCGCTASERDFHGSRGTIVDALGGEFAAMLALVVDGYGANRFGGCHAGECDAVYIDLTRNGSRRYCTPACTARAKTAAYRDRKRQDTTVPAG